MITIRLARSGKTGKPYFRIVAGEARSKPKAHGIETLGFWFRSKDKKSINKERLSYWVEKGAKVSASVLKLIEESQK